jgi:hypothetical protein
VVNAARLQKATSAVSDLNSPKTGTQNNGAKSNQSSAKQPSVGLASNAKKTRTALPANWCYRNMPSITGRHDHVKRDEPNS